MLPFITDDSVVAIYIHSAVSTTIWVGWVSLKNGRYEDVMACRCDVSCVAASWVPSPTQMAIDTPEWTYTATTTKTPIIKKQQ